MAGIAAPTVWALRLALLLGLGLGAPADSPSSPGVSPEPARATCPPSSFQCRPSGVCVHLDWRCDSDPDCPDGSDEEACTVQPAPAASPCPCADLRDCQAAGHLHRGLYNCSRQPCPAGELRCPRDGTCIPLTWLCDGHRDCTDGDDELDCGTEPLREGDAPSMATVTAILANVTSLGNFTATSAGGDQGFLQPGSHRAVWGIAAGGVLLVGLATTSLALLYLRSRKPRVDLKDCLVFLERKTSPL